MRLKVGVDDALRVLLNQQEPIDARVVKAMVLSGQEIPPVTDILVDAVDLSAYDQLLSNQKVRV